MIRLTESTACARKRLRIRGGGGSRTPGGDAANRSLAPAFNRPHMRRPDLSVRLNEVGLGLHHVPPPGAASRPSAGAMAGDGLPGGGTSPAISFSANR